MMKDPLNRELKNDYTIYRNKLIKNAKRNHISNCIKNNKFNSKSLCSSVDDLCGKSRSETQIEMIRTPD